MRLFLPRGGFFRLAGSIISPARLSCVVGRFRGILGGVCFPPFLRFRVSVFSGARKVLFFGRFGLSGLSELSGLSVSSILPLSAIYRRYSLFS